MSLFLFTSLKASSGLDDGGRSWRCYMLAACKQAGMTAVWQYGEDAGFYREAYLDEDTAYGDVETMVASNLTDVDIKACRQVTNKRPTYV